MPGTILLSAEAVAVLRFEIKGWNAKETNRRLAAYRELAGAGIMELVPGSITEYRFTVDGLARRDEILRAAEERIARERFEPPDGAKFSEAARALLRRLVVGEHVEADEATKPLYRELAGARIMFPVHTFARGRNSAYRFTYWGWEKRFELARLVRAKGTVRSPDRDLDLDRFSSMR